MGIVTRQGDNGTTKLLSGEEVKKSDPRLEVTGDLDELSSLLGLARALASRVPNNVCSSIARDITDLQMELLRLGSEFASSDLAKQKWVEPTSDAHVKSLESRIDSLQSRIELPRVFILPGACDVSAAMDIARAVARRLERHAVALAESGVYSNRAGLVYLNRLSDYLFLLARGIEHCSGVDFSSGGGGQ